MTPAAGASLCCTAYVESGQRDKDNALTTAGPPGSAGPPGPCTGEVKVLKGPTGLPGKTGIPGNPGLQGNGVKSQ